MQCLSIVSHDGGRHQKQTVTLAPNFSPAEKSASLWRPVMLSTCPRPRYSIPSGAIDPRRTSTFVQLSRH